MDVTGLSEDDATGWKRGLYADVERTFRAPVVNAVIRVPMAADPAFTRYTWGQVKPLFGTRAFGEFARAYRDALMSPVEERFDLPAYSPADLDLAPGEFRELRGQTATFDVVFPRLAVLMELLDRGLHGEPIGQEPDRRRAATEPLAESERTEPVLAPTVLDVAQVPAALDAVVGEIQDHHGFDDGLATIHRCHAQWPAFLEAAWDDLQPVLASDAYERGVERAGACVAEFVDSVPYRPRLDPEDLDRIGIGGDRVQAMADIARTFSRGPPRSVIRTIPLYAALVGVEGPRER